MKWHKCNSCDAEFRIISDTDELPEVCPFCATPLEDEEDEDEDDNYNDYDDE